MNKVRITGLALFLIGIVIQFMFDHDAIDFISGLFFGGGLVLLFTGKIGRS
jgi:hypothetical protein